MWPAAGSGFEADPFSPAGTAQREWGFIQGLGRTRFGKLVVWAILATFVFLLAVSLFSAVSGK